jgi:ankyrin repeat protein
MIAAQNGRIDLARILIIGGANVNLVNKVNKYIYLYFFLLK